MESQAAGGAVVAPGCNKWRHDPATMVFRTVALCAVSAALVMSLAVFSRSWQLPLLEEHSFRQTQTALAAYWLVHGGAWLTYELPVLGSPWPIPMELPIFQWIVAIFGALAPGNLDRIGRTVSYLFHLLTLLPIYSLCARYQRGRDAFLVTAALFLMAPTYLFWSRTFMIESTALFFTVSFLALYGRWVTNRGWWAGAAATIMGLAGILQKVTTFIPLLLVAGAVTVPSLLTFFRARQWGKLGQTALGALLVVGFPVVSLIIWVNYADAVKHLNPLAAQLTTEGLSWWNYGTVQQRLSGDLWVQVINNRALPEAVGGSLALWIGLGAAPFVKRRVQLAIAVLGLTYLVSILTFTNLHIVHNYYQCANAVLLVALVGTIISEVALSQPIAASLFLALVLAMQWLGFRDSYRPKINSDFSQAQTLLIADYLRKTTPRESAILVLGYDWSSEVAYYSERKSLTLPYWVKRDLAGKILESPSSFTKPLPVSAVVACWDRMPEWYRDMAREALAKQSPQRAVQIAGCDIFLAQGVGIPRAQRLKGIGPEQILAGEAFHVQPDESAGAVGKHRCGSPDISSHSGKTQLRTDFQRPELFMAAVPDFNAGQDDTRSRCWTPRPGPCGLGTKSHDTGRLPGRADSRG